jgi:hypothetical protein
LVPKALNNLIHSQLLIVLLLAIITVLSILYFNNHSKTLELEKELARINKELYLKQIILERRQKAFDEQKKKHHEQIERLKN